MKKSDEETESATLQELILDTRSSCLGRAEKRVPKTFKGINGSY